MAILSSPFPAASGRGSRETGPGRKAVPATEPGFVKRALAHPLSDYYLIVVSAALLLGLGTMMVLSASSVTAYVKYDDPYFFVKRQVVFLVLGVGAAWFFATRGLRWLRVVSWVAMLVSLLLLLAVFTPLGVDVNGNRNWLDLGIQFFRIQPSELAKVSMIMWAADVLARKDRLLEQPRHLLVPLAPGVGLLIALVLLEGDFGTAVIMTGIFVAVLFMVGAPLRLLLAMAGVGVLGSIGMVVSSENRMRRFLGFLHPGNDTLSTNMQPTMAVWALASGGWWGLGLGASRQKWGGLVEAHTDFVFAVIGEELGLLGTVSVLVLFLTLCGAGLRTAMRSRTLYYRYLAAGITAWFGLQAMVNLLVVMRLLPVMGVTLPLVSYGGASLMVNLAALGLLINCARHEPQAVKALSKDKVVRPRMTAVIGRSR